MDRIVSRPELGGEPAPLSVRSSAPERSRSVAVLRAIRVTAERLFGATSWEDEVDGMLERVGLAAGLSRVSVLRRASGAEDARTAARVYRWNAPGISSVGDAVLGEDLTATDPFTEVILTGFRDDDCLHGPTSTLPEPQRSIAQTQGSRAFAIAPISVGEDPWGVLMFDDCLDERSWSPSELDALRVTAGLLGAVIGKERVETDRKRTERQLAESEGQLRTIVEVEPECVSIVEADGTLIDMNPAGLAMIEADDLAQVRGKDVSSLVVEDDRQNFRDAIAQASSGTVGDEGFEIVGLKGTHRWLEATHTPLRDAADQIQSVLSVTRDVTDRRRAEEDLRESLDVLRSLSEERRALLERLDRAQEDERARISEDINDDSIQGMTALAFRLERLGRIVTEPEGLEIVERLKDQVSGTIGRLRRLSFELRPPVLDDGLAPALRALLDRMRELTGIDYRVESTIEREPGPLVRSILYRIAQEALVNVRKHSDARRVDVGLSVSADGFVVCIVDDGKGFAANGSGHAPLSPNGSLGLSAMRDRAERAGGWWRIDSTPGEGTTVEFMLPEEAPG